MPRARAPAAAGGARRARACELYARGRANYGFGDEQEPECHASVLCGSAHQSDSLFLAALWVCARASVDRTGVVSSSFPGLAEVAGGLLYTLSPVCLSLFVGMWRNTNSYKVIFNS